MSRPPILAMALTLLAGCQVYPSPPSLEPLEQPRALEAAPPRVNATIPSDRHRGDFEARGVATTPVVEPPAVPGVTGQPGEITLNFVDTDIREIVRTILGTTLKLNYTIDPNVHGTGSIETAAPMPRSALLPALETLLNENGATLVEKNGIYAVVPIAVGAASNRASGADAIGAGTQVVALRYAAAKDLAKTLEPFVAEGGKISADPGRNALVVRGDAAVRGTLVSLIRAFDIDLLAGQSYALFPAAMAILPNSQASSRGYYRPKARALWQVSFACCRWHGSMQFSWSPHSRVISMRPSALSASCIGPRMRPRAPGMFTMCRTVRARISSFYSSARSRRATSAPLGRRPAPPPLVPSSSRSAGEAVRGVARRVS